MFFTAKKNCQSEEKKGEEKKNEKNVAPLDVMALRSS